MFFIVVGTRRVPTTIEYNSMAHGVCLLLLIQEEC